VWYDEGNVKVVWLTAVATADYLFGLLVVLFLFFIGFSSLVSLHWGRTGFDRVA
jgi:hypothetical protein